MDFYKYDGSYYTATDHKKISNLDELNKLSSAGGKEINYTPDSSWEKIANSNLIADYDVKGQYGSTLYGIKKQLPEVNQSELTNHLPDNSIDSALKIYADRATNQDNSASQAELLKYQKMKETEAKLNAEKEKLASIQADKDKAVDDANSKFDPVMEQTMKMWEDAVGAFSQTDFQAKYDQLQTIEQDIVNYGNMLNEELDSVKTSGRLYGMATTEKNKIKQNYTSKIATAQASLSAIQGRAGMTAPISAYQSLRGQKTHAVNTPFGKVKPFDVMGESEEGLSAKESIGHGVETALTVLPAEKLLKPFLKYTGKLGKNLLSKSGEVLTGVESKRLDDWYDLAKKAPDKLKNVKSHIEANPDNPYLSMAQNISNKIGKLKTKAQEEFTGAVNTVKNNFPDTVFNLNHKIPELNNTLNKYGFKIDKVKEAGKFTDNIKVVPNVRNSAFTPQEIQMVDDLVQRMRLKDMNVDELLEFENGVKKFFDYATKGDDKRLISLGYELVEESSKFIDEVFPEVAGANSQYRDYYDIMKKVGNNIMDKDGSVKRGGETFLGNVLNFNKGSVREDVVKAGKKLGIDILEDVKNIRNAKQLTEAIPNTVRSRTAAIFRSIISSKAFGVAGGAGTAVNPAIGVPALILNLLSSPNRYRNLIEIIAGTAKKLPVTEAIEKLTPSESFMIRNLLKGLDGKED